MKKSSTSLDNSTNDVDIASADERESETTVSLNLQDMGNECLS